VKVKALASVQQPEGHYINRLAQALSKSSPTQGFPDLQQFLRHVPSREIRKHYNGVAFAALAEREPSGMLALAALPIQRMTGTGPFNAERIFRAASTETTLMLYAYIQHVLERQQLGIGIENIQAIDHSSLSLLTDLLVPQKGHFAVFEYTDDKPAGFTADDLCGVLEDTGSEVVSYRLNKLPLRDVLQLLSRDQLTTFIERAYYAHNGNLRDLADLEVYVGPTTLKELLDPPRTLSGTNLRLEGLDNGAKLTLACIVVHDRSAPVHLLQALHGRHTALRNVYWDPEACLRHLTADDLIVLNGEAAEVAHDWIADVVAASEGFRKYLVLAEEVWSILYEALYAARDYSVVSKSELLYRVFAFYVATDPTRLYGLLPEIRAFSVESRFPKNSVRLLEKLRNTLRKRDSNAGVRDEVTFSLVDVYYTLGLFAEAMDTLGELETESPRGEVYRAALLDRLDRHDETIEFIQSCLHRRTPQSAAYEFYLKMIMMVSYRSLNLYDECGEVYWKLIGDTRFHSLPCFPYLLRNAQMVLGRDDTLASLQESIARFQTLGNIVGEAHSRITLAMYRTMAGELIDAAGELARAEEMLRGRSIERHVVLNDQAVLHLLQGDAQAALDILNVAMQTVTTSFDRIAVQNNQLIAHTLAGNRSVTERIEAELGRDLPNQPDRVMHRVSYYNLAFAASRRGDEYSEKRLFDLARAQGSADSAYWAHRLEGAPIGDSPRKFLASFPFNPVFITNWHVEIIGVE
jgi:tetratricopeptide (TPR) repeat protein